MAVEEEIINDVIVNLKRLTNLDDIRFKPAGLHVLYDYELTINGIAFACEVKSQICKADYNLVIRQLERVKEQTEKPLIVAARHFSPDAFEKLAREGFGVIESSGNCKINLPPLFVNITGQKSLQTTLSKGKAFTEAGLKVVFYLLLDDGNIAKPYRQISKETGISLGTIKNVIEDLTQGLYVIKTAKGRFLKNKKELLDTWQIYYNRTLKPKLMLKEMEFVNAESRIDWSEINLPQGACWGGEGGAYLLDHYLYPEQFDIYTDVPTINLMMTKKMRFEPNGSIKVYQKFWKSDNSEEIAPKILIYADLMGSGNSRCIEAAQRLIEYGI